MPDEPREPSTWPRWVENFILPYVRIPALAPVVFAVMGHVVLLAALVVLSAWRDRSPFGFVGVALLVFGTGRVLYEERQRLGRLGPLSRVLGLSWAGTLVLAALAFRYGFL